MWVFIGNKESMKIANDCTMMMWLAGVFAV
jgi:hypothetical protein